MRAHHTQRTRARTFVATAVLLSLCAACADAGHRAVQHAVDERLTRLHSVPRRPHDTRHYGLPRLSARRLARLRAMLDRNGDGVVSPDEVARARSLLRR